MSLFTRPKSLKTPTIYHTFKARDVNSNKDVEFRVQDFPEDRFEQGVQYMVQNFFEHEAMGKTRNIKSDRNAVMEISAFWRHEINKKLSFVCFKEGCDDIIGMNIMAVKNKNDKEEINGFKSSNLNDIFNVMEYAASQFNPYEHFGVDEYLIAYGLCVDPAYRRRGIATEILRARLPLLKALDLKVTASAFTGPGSQRAAFKCGYKENFVISYDELYKINFNFIFPNIASTHFKTMSLTV